MSLRPRLCALTDIGGDPDDQQSMIRLMVYSNAFRLEGLCATASGTVGELENATPRPDLIREIVAGYAEVRPNLARFESGWPEADHLESLIRVGRPERGADAIGNGWDTDVSRHLIKLIDDGTPGDPLCITIWGGQTDLAQALWRVREERGADGLSRFIARFKVYDIHNQDYLAEWMRTEFPGMFYILAAAYPGRDMREGLYRGMYLGGDESLTSRDWIEEHVRSRGPLGALYPTKTWTSPNPYSCLKEGDTPSWFFFLPQGGNDPNDPTKPGWGGQFVREGDGWYRDGEPRDGFDPRESVSRWRPDFQADFATRMKWCL